MRPDRGSKMRLAGAALLAAAALPRAAPAQPVPAPSFQLIGHIEEFSLQNPAEVMSAATMRVRNIDVTLPQGLLVTMPGGYLTAGQLFRNPDGSLRQSSGLALKDRPPVPFEAEIIGNISQGQYLAGVVRLSQGALHAGAGFIQAIDNATGELRVGAKDGGTGARVRLNDPKGRYGLSNAQRADVPMDERFALDPDNSPVHAKTGFPVCIAGPGQDAKCPASNRPADEQRRFRFTCGPVANAGVPAHAGCDPLLPVPLQVGDYVTYVGMLQQKPDGTFLIAAHGLDAELGVYTSPNQEPVYLFIEEALQGTKGEPFANVLQEETTRFRIVGFTTDPTRNVEVRIIDSGRNETGASFTGPGGMTPSNGPPLGRFRNTWGAKDDARAVRRDVQASVVGSSHQKLANGLTSGMYTAPISEYIYPEPKVFGVPGYPVPVPFENFCFLASGGGAVDTLAGPVSPGRLAPFPESGHPLSQPIGNGPARACDGE